MNTIIIKNLIGNNAFSMKQGSILYNVLFEKLKNNEPVNLDFDGVLIASPFFNASISYLLKDYSISYVLKMINVTGLSDSSKSILNISIHNAISYYS